MGGNKKKGKIKIKVPLPVFGTAQQEKENPHTHPSPVRFQISSEHCSKGRYFFSLPPPA